MGIPLAGEPSFLRTEEKEIQTQPVPTLKKAEQQEGEIRRRGDKKTDY